MSFAALFIRDEIDWPYARTMKTGPVKDAAMRLNELYRERKEPEFFYEKIKQLILNSLNRKQSLNE